MFNYLLEAPELCCTLVLSKRNKLITFASIFRECDFFVHRKFYCSFLKHPTAMSEKLKILNPKN